jgi:hypothetical protein
MNGTFYLAFYLPSITTAELPAVVAAAVGSVWAFDSPAPMHLWGLCDGGDGPAHNEKRSMEDGSKQPLGVMEIMQ